MIWDLLGTLFILAVVVLFVRWVASYRDPNHYHDVEDDSGW